MDRHFPDKLRGLLLYGDVIISEKFIDSLINIYRKKGYL